MGANKVTSINSEKYSILKKHLNERSLRLCAAADARSIGRGGISVIAKASKLARNTIYAGLRELDHKHNKLETEDSNRIRKKGGGRKKIIESTPELLQALDQLVDPVTRGDPESTLRWTCKSTTKLADELNRKGYKVSQKSVWSMLDHLGYSMQSNRKKSEGAEHPDRDVQFQFISDRVNDFIKRNQPVISVDTKKKELVGNFKNAGREWRKKGCPENVNLHDFSDPQLGKVIPYGVYDITYNKGWVSVGITHDTAEFAVQTIRTWWKTMGVRTYPNARELLITADGGGSNGWRVRLWKIEIQKLANELGMTIHVSHFPPGTSKWNKIEHRMFCHITENWRSRPLESRAVIVNLIANTRTKQGLHIKAALDERHYEIGKKIAHNQMNKIHLEKCNFHGEWNYKIRIKN